MFVDGMAEGLLIGGPLDAERVPIRIRSGEAPLYLHIAETDPFESTPLDFEMYAMISEGKDGRPFIYHYQRVVKLGNKETT